MPRMRMTNQHRLAGILVFGFFEKSFQLPRRPWQHQALNSARHQFER
jgi:hypothetical protein